MSDGSNYSKIQAEGKTISAGEEYDKLWGADGVADMVRGIMGVASSASSSASSSALPSLPPPQLSTFAFFRQLRCCQPLHRRRPPHPRRSASGL